MATTTSAAPPCRLLSLSAELRLAIYLDVVIACLAEGRPTALAGLFLSCRTIQQEMQAEFGSKLQPLLAAQTAWGYLSRCRADAARLPLRLHLSHTLLTPRARPGELLISLPVLSGWLFRRQPLQSLESDELFQGLVTNLQPLLLMPWTQLALSFCKMAYVPGVSFSLTRSVVVAFFKALGKQAIGTEPRFGCVDRLVLNYGSAMDPVCEGHFRTLFTDCLRYSRRKDVCGMRAMPVPARGWIARVTEGRRDEQGWKIVYDFKDGLPSVDGALWQVVEEDGLCQAKRMFEGDMDEVLDSEHWEKEYALEGDVWEIYSSGFESEDGGDEDDEIEDEDGSESEDDGEVDHDDDGEE